MRRQVTGVLAAGTLLLTGLVVVGDTAPATSVHNRASDDRGPAATRTDASHALGHGRLGQEPKRVVPPAETLPPSSGRSTPVPVEQIGVEQRVDAVIDDHPTEGATVFRYPGASYVKVHFRELALLPGDYVTVSDPAGRESYTYRGPASLAESLLSRGTRERWAMSVTGEAAVVTLHRGKKSRSESVSRMFGRSRVSIDRVARGFTAQELAARRATERRPESVCGFGDDKYDVVCYQSRLPTEYAHSRPVAKMLIGGTGLCTAWRIGPQNRMLTNHHCIASNAAAQNTEVWFNYQCVTCGGLTVDRVTKVVGSRVIATDQTLDYTLFSVSDFEAIRDFGYLMLDDRVTSPGELVYIPQHPRGAPKQLAISSDDDLGGACQVADPVYDGYQRGTDVAYRCDTEAGSSGSPVISRRTHRVVALHHFGGCPNSGVRSDLLLRQLQRHL